MKCTSCGSELQEFQYQSRSADEPHSVSIKCPYCPLDVDRFYSNLKATHLYLPRKPKTRCRTPVVSVKCIRTAMLLTVFSSDFMLCNGKKRLDSHATNILNEKSDLFKVYTSGHWAGLAIHRHNKRCIAPNAFVWDAVISENASIDSTQYRDFEYVLIGEYMCIIEHNRVSIHHIIEDSCQETILGHLNAIYLQGFCPLALTENISKVDLGAMSNLTARAYDSNKVRDQDYTFSTKPDGERMWLVKIGSVWLYVRRLLGFSITGFGIDTAMTYSDPNRVLCALDCEMMLAHAPILIDILIDDNGQISKYDRTLEWIARTMTRLIDKYPYLHRIHQRPFFQTMAEADAYRMTAPYPVDGLVAISMSGVDMRKIKNVRSMELQVRDNGFLATKEGKDLLRLPKNSPYKTGCIVEIRFQIDSNGFQIHEVFQRFDKISANTNEAVISIIESCIAPSTNSLTRTILWRWSNRVRSFVYKYANNFKSENNIVLDVGSGSGQSSDAFKELGDYSFILIEPDAEVCQKLAKRLQKTVYSDPRSLIPAIPALKRGTKKYHILNTTLQCVLADKAVVQNLKGILKCCIGCFSSHYIVDSIQQLHELRIPFIGCFYSYHDVGEGESIINQDGIRMTRLSDTLACVQWGRDTSYEEPVVDNDSIPLQCQVVDASQLVPPGNEGNGTIPQSFYSSLKVLIWK